jgi:hypothetical protein
MSADDAGGGAWGRRRRSGPAASPHGVCSAAMLEVGAPWHLIVALATLGGPAAFDGIRYHEGGVDPVTSALRCVRSRRLRQPSQAPRMASGTVAGATRRSPQQLRARRGRARTGLRQLTSPARSFGLCHKYILYLYLYFGHGARGGSGARRRAQPQPLAQICSVQPTRHAVRAPRAS